LCTFSFTYDVQDHFAKGSCDVHVDGCITVWAAVLTVDLLGPFTLCTALLGFFFFLLEVFAKENVYLICKAGL
jgi:hypothetical protein